MSEPTGVLATKLGVIHFVMTDANHVYMRTWSDADETLTINRVRYHVSFHCYLVDGQWVAKDWHEPYLSRPSSCVQPSDAARIVAREVLSAALTEHLAAHPGLTRQAARADAEKTIERLADELAKLSELAAIKTGELSAAQKKLADLA